MSGISKDICPYCESTNYYQEIYMDCINCGHKEKINSSGLESHIKEIGNNWDANLVNSLQSKIDELILWKEHAMEVMYPMQELGEAIGLNFGESIHDKVLPYIEKQKIIVSRFKEEANKWFEKSKSQSETITKLREGLGEIGTANLNISHGDMTALIWKFKRKANLLLSELKNNVS
jgi:hypothetical protein